MTKRKYVVEVFLSGVWTKHAVWTCHQSKFRELLDCFAGDSCMPTVRIKRAPDKLKADYQWPLTS